MGSHRLIGGSPTTPLTINLHMVQLDQNLLNNSISLQAQFATKRAMADLLHKLQDTIPDMQLHLVGVLQTGEYQHHLLVSMLDSLHNLLPPAETLLILNNYIQKHTLVNIVGLKASVMKQNICDDTPTNVCSPINKNTDNNCSIERPDESTSYYSFDHDSYMQLSNLGQEQLQTISLQFITQQSTGVLLYSSLPNHGFFAVDIINGQLRLAVSNLNSEIQEVLLNMSLNRSAKWHQLSLTVHHSPQQPAYIMAVLDVCNAQDDCEHCSTNDCKAILSPISWLPLFWDTLLVGGLDEQAFNQPNQVSDYGFVGCVRQVLFNNNHLLAAFHHHFDHVQQVDPSRVIGICALLENIGEACTTTDQPACSGHCIKESNKFNRCICVQDGAYEAANCSSDFDTISLDKSSLRYRLSNHYRRQLLFVPRAGNLVHKSEDLYLHAHIPPKKRHDFLSLTAQDSVEQDSVQWLELDFRTISQDVVLLAIHFEGARKSIIQIINGSVHLTVSNTAPILQISLDKRVDDAQWHRLSLEIADDGKMARLEVDGMAKEEHISTAFPQLITPN
uniref:Laminin G domain-containing protein n=1 Tax=Ditylenchus dipsaci TaxID=166011 RepID=A0A915EE11_9BILA